MDASIVIPAYNRLNQLKVTLRALEGLDYARDSFEVILVDDGSEDGTAAFFSEKALDFQFRLIRHTSNRGRAAARNSGVREAQGKVVVFLDDDMKPAPGFLRAHLRRHAKRRRLVVIGNVHRSQEVRSTAVVRYLDSRGVHKLRPNEPVPFRYFITNNVSLEREFLAQVGLFDERFRTFGGEDLELGYRLKKAQATFVFEPEACAHRTDYRDVSELCKVMVIYGESSLPLILEIHPELQELFQVHLLEPVRLFSDRALLTFKKLLFRLAMWRPWGPIMTLLARSCDRLFVPALLFDYLIVFHYTRGLRKYRWRCNQEGNI